MLIFLIGFMGSGKTTAGKMLAERLQYDFADTDDLIEQRENMEITRIFAQKGEEYFRRVEAEVLESLLKNDNMVISCGGGTPCFFDNMRKMNNAGITVYLKVSSKTIAQRVSEQHSNRPLIAGIKGDKLITHIRKLLSGREGWYRQSRIIYPADNFNLDELAGQIEEFTKEQQ